MKLTAYTLYPFYVSHFIGDLVDYKYRENSLAIMKLSNMEGKDTEKWPNMTATCKKVY